MATLTLRSVKGTPLTNTEVDNNFSNLNTDKYESGDSVSVDDLVVTGETTVSTSASVSAAGTVQGDATALTKTYNIVTTATVDQGVQLPSAATGKSCTVLNATSVNIKIYPATSDQIDSLSVNVAKDLAAGASYNLVCSSSSEWKTLQPTLIFDSSGARLN